MRELRRACAAVASRAEHVAIQEAVIGAYASSLPFEAADDLAELDDQPQRQRSREEDAALWLTLDAINFGSGWFPTLRKRPGRSGYFTIAAGIRERFESQGAWEAQQLAKIQAPEIGTVLGQDPSHELMELFAASLRDLGEHVRDGYDGCFSALVDSAEGSAVALVRRLGGWNCFADTSSYDGISITFLKRAQIAAADLARGGVAAFTDLDQLTMFADNLVPHVLRLDGILQFAHDLVERIEREELIPHVSREEIEIRACAVQAVELIVAAAPGHDAVEADQLLWNRGQQPRYKAVPRHRTRCTAY